MSNQYLRSMLDIDIAAFIRAQEATVRANDRRKEKTQRPPHRRRREDRQPQLQASGK